MGPRAPTGDGSSPRAHPSPTGLGNQLLALAPFGLLPLCWASDCDVLPAGVERLAAARFRSLYLRRCHCPAAATISQMSPL